MPESAPETVGKRKTLTKTGGKALTDERGSLTEGEKFLSLTVIFCPIHSLTFCVNVRVYACVVKSNPTERATYSPFFAKLHCCSFFDNFSSNKTIQNTQKFINQYDLRAWFDLNSM